MKNTLSGMSRQTVFGAATQLVDAGFNVSVAGRAGGGTIRDQWSEWWTLVAELRAPMSLEQLEPLFAIAKEHGLTVHAMPGAAGFWLQAS